MGRLLRIEPCPVCNYHIEDMLFHGGSTRMRLFIYNRYVLAHCRACKNIVSILEPTPKYELERMLEAAVRDIVTLQERSAQGDAIARRLLPLHMLALDEQSDMGDDPQMRTCTVCDSRKVKKLPEVGGDDGEHYDDGTAFIACPRCEEGQLWVRTAGMWDEIDSGL